MLFVQPAARERGPSIGANERDAGRRAAPRERATRSTFHWPAAPKDAKVVQ